MPVGFLHISGCRIVWQAQCLVVRAPLPYLGELAGVPPVLIWHLVRVQEELNVLFWPIIHLHWVGAREIWVLGTHFLHPFCEPRRARVSSLICIRLRRGPLFMATTVAARECTEADLWCKSILKHCTSPRPESLEEGQQLRPRLVVCVEVPQLTSILELRLRQQLPAHNLPQTRTHCPSHGKWVFLPWQWYVASLALKLEFLLLHHLPTQVLLQLYEELVFVGTRVNCEATFGTLHLEVLGWKISPAFDFEQSLEHLLFGVATEHPASVCLRFEVIQGPPFPPLLLWESLFGGPLRLWGLYVSHDQHRAPVKVFSVMQSSALLCEQGYSPPRPAVREADNLLLEVAYRSVARNRDLSLVLCDGMSQCQRHRLRLLLVVVVVKQML
mmetsp:Transcript_42464/g.98396  ORF Transcript_42464/g.98396 Transcript_42464/m.98396 type:complete len:385 (+) Transcript_42464:206-1360(+)